MRAIYVRTYCSSKCVSNQETQSAGAHLGGGGPTNGAAWPHTWRCATAGTWRRQAGHSPLCRRPPRSTPGWAVATAAACAGEVWLASHSLCCKVSGDGQLLLPATLDTAMIVNSWLQDASRECTAWRLSNGVMLKYKSLRSVVAAKECSRQLTIVTRLCRSHSGTRPWIRGYTGRFRRLNSEVEFTPHASSMELLGGSNDTDVRRRHNIRCHYSPSCFQTAISNSVHAQ